MKVNCPVCGTECKVVGKTTKHYEPVNDLTKLAEQCDREKVAKTMYEVLYLLSKFEELPEEEQHWWVVKSDAIIQAIKEGSVFK